MAEAQEPPANQKPPANQIQEVAALAENKSFNDRLNEIPMYTMSLNQLCSVYSNIRERHEVLKKAFDVGEYYARSIASTAKPVVMSATTSALAAAKPVIGEVKDPGKMNISDFCCTCGRPEQWPPRLLIQLIHTLDEIQNDLFADLSLLQLKCFT